MKIFHEAKHIDRLLKLAERHGSYGFDVLRTIVTDLLALELELDEHVRASRELGLVIKAKRIEWLNEQY